MKKNQPSPIPEGTRQILERARRLQDKVNEITGRNKEPEYTRGTIEPPVKK